MKKSTSTLAVLATAFVVWACSSSSGPGTGDDVGGGSGGAAGAAGAAGHDASTPADASDAPTTFTATAAGDSHLTVTPPTVSTSTTAKFNVTALTGFLVSPKVTGTCPAGSWSGSDYTTGTLTADCTVTFASESGNKRLFLSQGGSTGKLGASAAAAIAAADALCNGDAGKPAGAGSYKAMIASSARRACTSPACATGGATEGIDWVLKPGATYFRADGTTKIGTATAAGVLTFPVLASLTSDNGHMYYTGLKTDWTTATDDCLGFTDDAPTSSTTAGYEGSTGAGFISYDGLWMCEQSGRMLCVEQ